MKSSIKKRKSVRTYRSEKLQPTIKKNIQTLLEIEQKGPFQHNFDLQILGPMTTTDKEDMPIVASYGVIKGNVGYLYAYTQKDTQHLVDYGYCLEKIVLELTNMGLGTCWLGGTFKRDKLTDETKEMDTEIPAVIAFGVPAQKTRLLENVMRGLSGAQNRKNSEQLFFDKILNNALTLESPYDDIFESVRLAPSAMNGQPWRIIKDHNVFHFYKEAKRSYGVKNIDMKDIDMGIAMAHFEIACKAHGIQGQWEIEEIAHYQNHTYIASFVLC